MPVLLPEDYEYKLPRMYTIHQHFPDAHLDEPETVLKESLSREEIRVLVKSGMKVAVAVGSRGITGISQIVKITIDYLKELGASPFIVSAMGSHGGGTKEGQREVLASYGITEENMGVPVVTDTDTVDLGARKNGQHVWFDRAAYQADLIVPINRIKLHTDFVGELQSGLCKMLVIGLGNQKGCSAAHETDFEEFSDMLEESAALIIKKAPVGFGVAIMENAFDETCLLEAVPAGQMIAREKELVKLCVEKMPYIQVKKADIIIVEEIGKDISGAGFDPNILGRSTVRSKYLLPIPEFQKLVLLDVTEASHGNAIGVGLFDVITEKVFSKMDREATYANAIACKCILDARIPMIAKDEDEAVRIAVKSCRSLDMENLRIIRIKNTLNLEKIQVSEAIYREEKSLQIQFYKW
ncbi:MAG: lactate racemase domain-containing protein [Clostridia bacterium]|nr:lactate racemase domain-containing protein [Clostridia bacterium]